MKITYFVTKQRGRDVVPGRYWVEQEFEDKNDAIAYHAELNSEYMILILENGNVKGAL